MIHLANLRDNDLECLLPSLGEEEFKNYSFEENFKCEIFQNNIDIEIKSSTFNSALAFENPQSQNQSVIDATNNPKSEEEIIKENYLAQGPFFSSDNGDNDYLDNLDSYFLMQRTNDDLIVWEEGKKLKHEIAGENLSLQEKLNEGVFFPIKTLENKNVYLNSEIDEAVKLSVEADRNLLNKKNFEPPSWKLDNPLNNYRKSILFSNDSSARTDLVENKTQTFLGIKTNRSEASSFFSTNKSFDCAELHRKVTHKTDSKQTEHLAEYNNGRWSDAEHELFIEALIKYGKNWKKIKRHIKTRKYYQVVQYTTRFFNRIAKFFDISSTLSYDSMNNFRKLIFKNIVNRYPNQNPNYTFDVNNSKNEDCRQSYFQGLFLQFISGINNNNFRKFCDEYSAIMSNDTKAYFIDEFLILNPVKSKNFRIIKEDLFRDYNKNSIDNEVIGSKGEQNFYNKVCEESDLENKTKSNNFGRNKLLDKFTDLNTNINESEPIPKLSDTNSKSTDERYLVVSERFRFEVINSKMTKTKTKLNEENGLNLTVEEKLFQNSQNKGSLICHSKNDFYFLNQNSEYCNFNKLTDKDNYEGNNSNTKSENSTINNCNLKIKNLINFQITNKVSEKKNDEESKIAFVENEIENKQWESNTIMNHKDTFNSKNRSNDTQIYPSPIPKELLNNDNNENSVKTDASFFKERIYKNSIYTNLYENLKIYFKDSDQIHLKNLNLKLDIEKELEIHIRQKLGKFMIKKDESPIFIFNPRTNRYEISNKQGRKKNMAEANKNKKSFNPKAPV